MSQIPGYGRNVDERAVKPGEHGTVTSARGGADEARRVLERLERIEALDRRRASAAVLLGELRELVHEAEAWARVDAGERRAADTAKLREEGGGMG